MSEVSVDHKQVSAKDSHFFAEFLSAIVLFKDCRLRPWFWRLLSDDLSVNVQILMWANLFFLSVIALSGNDWL